MTGQALVNLVETEWLGRKKGMWKAALSTVCDPLADDISNCQHDLSPADYKQRFGLLLNKMKCGGWLHTEGELKKAAVAGWIVERGADDGWVLKKFGPEMSNPRKQVEDDKEGGSLTTASKVCIGVLMGVAVLPFVAGVRCVPEARSEKAAGRRKEQTAAKPYPHCRALTS